MLFTRKTAMTIDANKLKLFLQMPPMLEPVTPPGLDESDIEEIKGELEDPASEASQATRKMGYGVRYMELTEPAGAFSCATCEYATPEEFCVHEMVRARVSGEYGCCNLFEPRDKGLLSFPPPKGASIFGESVPEEPEE